MAAAAGANAGQRVSSSQVPGPVDAVVGDRIDAGPFAGPVLHGVQGGDHFAGGGDGADPVSPLHQRDTGVFGAVDVVSGRLHDRGERRLDVGLGLQGPGDRTERGTQADVDGLRVIGHSYRYPFGGPRSSNPSNLTSMRRFVIGARGIYVAACLPWNGTRSRWAALRTAPSERAAPAFSARICPPPRCGRLWNAPHGLQRRLCCGHKGPSAASNVSWRPVRATKYSLMPLIGLRGRARGVAGRPEVGDQRFPHSRTCRRNAARSPALKASARSG